MDLYHPPTPSTSPRYLLTSLDREAKCARKKLMDLPSLSWLVRAANIGTSDPRWGNKGLFSARLLNFVKSKLLKAVKSTLSTRKIACSAILQNSLMLEDCMLAQTPRSKSAILALAKSTCETVCPGIKLS